MKSLRDYITLIEGQQQDTVSEAVAPAAAPTGNSFDAKLAQMQAAQKAKGVRTGPVASTTPQPDPKGPGARPTGWIARTTGADARWDTANAAKWNPDGTAKKPAVAVAKAKSVTPAPQQAAQPAPQQAAEPTAPVAPVGPWPAGSPQDAAWQKLTPEDQKWIGQADPTDQMILARAPNGGKPAAAPAQGAQPAPVAQAARPGVKAGGEVVDTRGGATGQDEMEESAPGALPEIVKTPDGFHQVVAGDKTINVFWNRLKTTTTPVTIQATYQGKPVTVLYDPVPTEQGTYNGVPADGKRLQEGLTSFQNDELSRIVSLVQHR